MVVTKSQSSLWERARSRSCYIKALACRYEFVSLGRSHKVKYDDRHIDDLSGRLQEILLPRARMAGLSMASKYKVTNISDFQNCDYLGI